MPLQLRGIIRTVTEGRAQVWTPSGTGSFAVAGAAVADVMKAVLAQARVSLAIEGDVIVGVELLPGSS
jgi:hypothetical protein